MLPVVAALAFVAAQPTFAQMAQQPNYRHVSVTGEGTVHVVPDMAVVRFGIVTQDPDPEAARARNAAASREAMNVVRQLGVPERKLRLEELRLQPAREYNRETQRWEEIGFEVSRMLVVELEELDRLPELIARVVQGGANRLNQVSYDLQDRDTARRDALREALLNARSKAELMAETLDAGLGKVMQINEQGVVIPVPMPIQMESDVRMMQKADPEPEAYAAGELDIRATIQVVFMLEDD